MKTKLILSIIAIWLSLNLPTYSQKAILFDRTKGYSNTLILPGIFLSQNEAEVKRGDTTINIFNFYFSSDTLNTHPLNADKVYKNDQLTTLYNDIVISAIPIVTPGTKLKLKQISEETYKNMKVMSKEGMLRFVLPSLRTHATTRQHQMPSLKYSDFSLIIKHNGVYYQVEHPVFVTTNLVCNDQWYFPNQFRDGILNVNEEFTKSYDISYFTNIARETKRQDFVERELTARIYLSKINRDNPFKMYVFDYWEFLNGDSQSIHMNLQKLKQYHPGLGSFSFLPKVGVINCTLDYYLTGKIRVNQQVTYDHIILNRLSPQQFERSFKTGERNMIRSIE